jgi:hypothetical protein
MKHVLRINGTLVEAALAGPAGARKLMLADGAHAVALKPEADGAFTVFVDGATARGFQAGTEEQLFVLARR